MAVSGGGSGRSTSQVSGARRERIEGQQVVEDRGAGARLAHDDDGLADPDRGDLGMAATPFDDAQTVGQLVHDVAGGDLDAEIVEPCFGSEALDEEVEALLPRRFAEVVTVDPVDGLGDQTVTMETVVAHVCSRSTRSRHVGCGSDTRTLLWPPPDPAWSSRSQMASDSQTAPTTMRAWRTHEYGPPLDALHLDEVEVPVPDANEVRVRVQAIPLNLNDLERVTGGNMMVEPELPYSPGMEVMGIVDACGDGTEAWLGRRVVATTKGANGGYAEYAVCPAVSTFAMPDSIPLPDAAALYFPFHLAWLGLFDRADLRPGETVLIHAGAGGSGSAAIQLAVHRGATVIATAGTDQKVELCRELGAEVAINYTTTDFAEVVLAETGNRASTSSSTTSDQPCGTHPSGAPPTTAATS